MSEAFSATAAPCGATSRPSKSPAFLSSSSILASSFSSVRQYNHAAGQSPGQKDWHGFNFILGQAGKKAAHLVVRMDVLVANGRTAEQGSLFKLFERGGLTAECVRLVLQGNDANRQ